MSQVGGHGGPILKGAAMCRITAVTYGPTPDSVPQARHWLRDRLEAWDLTLLEPDASLLLTELVTNAVIHAQSQVHVTATVADGLLEIAVSDHELKAQMPYSHETVILHSAVSDGDGLSEDGRGMWLVDAISDAWGVATLGPGKQVWFRLSVDENWAHRTACPCHGEDLERTRLASGRFAIAVAGPWDH
jgi:anti-sigma regulatory factor (Ser/Thr protein kinase)